MYSVKMMPLSQDKTPYIIAEIGANHNGDMELARKMIAEAKGLGCDCVKFQSFDTRLFASEVYEKSRFLEDGRDVSSDLKTAVETYAVSGDDLKGLRDYCRNVDIDFSSSVFEADQARDLAALDPAFIKVASMDVNNDHMLRAIACQGKPVVLSTGMASLEEIAHAVETIEAEGNRDLVLLHCVSIYPAPDSVVNLNNIPMLEAAFGYPVGFSDHTQGTAVPVAAVAKGAVMIEKHFTLDHDMAGWDHAMSADPAEMAALVRDAKRAHAALGSARRNLSQEEQAKRAVMRRSIVSARAIPVGKPIEEADLTFRRPGTGLEPNLAPTLIGRVGSRDIPEDTVLRLEDLAGPES